MSQCDCCGKKVLEENHIEIVRMVGPRVDEILTFCTLREMVSAFKDALEAYFCESDYREDRD